MRIYLAADHAGYALKEKIKAWLEERGIEVKDCGAFKEELTDDYPDFIKCAAAAVSKNPDEVKAIIMGGSGQGEAMVANRYKGVRAAVFYGGPDDMIEIVREHNDANILSIGARFISEADALKAVKLWLETPFSGDERHMRRLSKF